MHPPLPVTSFVLRWQLRRRQRITMVTIINDRDVFNLRFAARKRTEFSSADNIRDNRRILFRHVKSEIL